MPELPPQRRTDLWAKLAPAVGGGQLILPRCRDCDTVQYPLRELCRACLGENLEWAPVPDAGKLLSWTLVRASVEPFFRAHSPWPVGRVKLDCGPIVIAHLAVETQAMGMNVRVLPYQDLGGTPVLIIVPEASDRIISPVAALISGP